jgi:hypothetical protein
MSMVTFEELSEDIPDHLKPFLDREVPPPNLTPLQRKWRNDGLVILRKIIDPALIDAYCERWIKDKPFHKKWRPNVPYMDVHEIRDLCLAGHLMDTLGHLVGEEMGLHLNLCNWVSTERDWHQDSYLNPTEVYNHYLAVWFALDDIDPDSGPFEYIRGSHKWPLMSRQKVWDAAPFDMKNSAEWNDHWPTLTQGFVSRACDEKILQENAVVDRFIPANKGDVLVWNGALVHRGSAPRVRGLERRALISHYSGLNHRHDMPVRKRHNDQGMYFVL